MSVMSLEPQVEVPSPEPEDIGGEEELLCFRCLVGNCRHRKPSPLAYGPKYSRHVMSSVTLLAGTSLCADCAVDLRDAIISR